MNQPAFPTLPVPPGPAGVDALADALRRLLAGGPGFRVAPAPPGTPAVLPGPETSGHEPPAAVVVPTSGSTGSPHQVILPLAAVMASADLGAAALGEPGYWLTSVPVTGVGGLLTVLRSLRAGLQPTVWPGLGGAGSFTAASFVASAGPLLDRAVAEGRPAYVSLVPTQLTRLLADPHAADVTARFTRVLIGGSALPPPLLARSREAGIAVVSTYGATETCGGVVYDGQPLPGVDVTIAGGEPDGATITVGGPTVAAGYQDDPGNPRLSGGVFHTGDLGRWKDGRLEVLGRQDHLIKSGGEKVSLPAIGEVLRADPRVADVAVLPMESVEWGTVAQVYVVPVGPTEGLAEDLCDAVVRRLGRAHRPHTMTLVPEIPTGPAGKPAIDRGL